MSNIRYVERSQRIAHGARTAADLAQYAKRESLRASVKFERPAFNRSAWEAVTVGALGGFFFAALQLAGLL